MFNINPLDVLNHRQVKTLPPHFCKSKLTDSNFVDEKITNWVKANLKGRFCIVRSPGVDSKGSFRSSTVIGFEDPKEMTYFMLACPHLRKT